LTVVEPDSETFSIVALGDFNPAILQPLWFSVNGLVPEEEARNADVDIIHKQFASFSMGGIRVQVDDSRLGITAVESPKGPILRDLVLGTLSILEHTPLKAIGLNRDMVFVMDTDDAWHEVDNRLVPKSDWEQILACPGMRQVVVEGRRSDCSADRLHVRVQPSAARSILIAVNQHYQLETKERVEVRDRHNEAIRVLNDDWPPFLTYAREAALKLLHPSSPVGQPE
jgi:hypothetical protein